MEPMRWLRFSAIVAIWACLGCPRAGTKGSSQGDGGDAPPSSDGCEQIRLRVRMLYTKNLAPGESAELASDLLQANVDMVLADCRASPERVLPCVKSAAQVAQLERDCLIPLDDEGTVEGKRFGTP